MDQIRLLTSLYPYEGGNFVVRLVLSRAILSKEQQLKPGKIPF